MRPRRAALAAAATALAAAVSLAALAAAVLLRPELFVTPGMVARVVRILGGPSAPRWRHLALSIRSPDARTKEIAFEATDVCFSRGGAAGCLARVGGRFTLELSASGVRLARLSRLAVSGGHVRVQAPKAGPRRARPGLPESVGALPTMLCDFPIGRVEADLPRLQVVASGTVTRLGVRLRLAPSEATPLTGMVRWRRLPGGPARGGRAWFWASSDRFERRPGAGLRAGAVIESEDWRARLNAVLRAAGARDVAVRLDVDGRKGPSRFGGEAEGRWSPDGVLRLDGALSLVPPDGPVRRLSVAPFRLDAVVLPGAGIETAKFEGDYRAELEPRRAGRWRAPERLDGRLTAAARSAPRPGEPDRFEAELSATAAPRKQWYAVDGALRARAAGRWSRPREIRVDHEAAATIAVPRFEDLVAFLAGTPYAVPAPLDVLSGPMFASLTARGGSGGAEELVELRGSADLAGGPQRLRLRLAGRGRVRRPGAPDRRIDADLTAFVDGATLQAPHLDPLKMPRVALDPRIKPPPRARTAPAAAPGPAESPVFLSTANVSLKLRAVATRPVIILTDLAKTPVPVSFDVRLEKPPGSVGGLVSLEPFRVEFFRRPAQVERVRLSRAPGSRETALDALIRYQAEEAAIRIRLGGTTAKPQISFESDPPMSQDDVIAMLLFGKSPDELDADQAATLANAQTAMADKVFGLASLYFFASTPIQYVGYDPASRSYSVRFRIPGGETLEMNSNFDETRRVQLRRRLSRHFAIRAEAASSSSQAQRNGVTTFLEWFTRY